MLLYRCLLLAALLMHGASAWSADVPPEIVGTWATAESEFSGEKLIGGEALFVLPGGQVAIVGAPLPVRRDASGRYYAPIIGIGGTATYDPGTHQLKITLRDGQKSLDGVANYLGDEAVIEWPETPDKKVRLVRRSSAPPAWLQAEFDKAAAQQKSKN